jgi:hypothetical protein
VSDRSDAVERSRRRALPAGDMLSRLPSTQVMRKTNTFIAGFAVSFAMLAGGLYALPGFGGWALGAALGCLFCELAAITGFFIEERKERRE